MNCHTSDTHDKEFWPLVNPHRDFVQKKTRGKQWENKLSYLSWYNKQLPNLVAWNNMIDYVSWFQGLAVWFWGLAGLSKWPFSPGWWSQSSVAVGWRSKLQGHLQLRLRNLNQVILATSQSQIQGCREEDGPQHRRAVAKSHCKMVCCWDGRSLWSLNKL